jgi:hypothetical protein
MKFVLEDETLRNIARTDDAVEAFANAANNGQTRLAMELLVPIVEQIAELLEEYANEEQVVPEAKKPDPEPVKKVEKKTAAKAASVDQEENLA